eukprot:1308147-Pleurochrysis_carterae.AAC.1
MSSDGNDDTRSIYTKTERSSSSVLPISAMTYMKKRIHGNIKLIIIAWKVRLRLFEGNTPIVTRGAMLMSRDCRPSACIYISNVFITR